MKRFIALILIFINLVSAEEINVGEFVFGDCQEKTVSNQYGVFIQKFCNVYLGIKRVGGLKIEEHITPPFYGMIGGYLELNDRIYVSDLSKGKYFAIYEPFEQGLKIETMCGIRYSQSSDLKEVWKAILDCFKEKENGK